MRLTQTQLKNILIALCVAVAVFSIYKYVQALKEKYDLINALDQAKQQIVALEVVKQSLSVSLEKEKALQQKISNQNQNLKVALKAGHRRMALLFSDVRQMQKELDDGKEKYRLIKAENKALIADRKELGEKVVKLSEENVNLKARMSSAKELRKAIWELRHQIRKVGSEIRENAEQASGNKGFVIKDGKPTASSNIKIEVIPAETPKQ